MQGWQCPIYNDTLKSCVISSRNKIYIIHMFYVFVNCSISIVGSLQKMKRWSELNSFRAGKTKAFLAFLVRLRFYFKGTVVNRALTSLYGESLAISLTVPLTCISGIYYLPNLLCVGMILISYIKYQIVALVANLK